MEKEYYPVEAYPERPIAYTTSMNGLRKVRGWKGRDESRIPVTFTDIRCQGADHDLLIRRSYEDMQRILFKVSSMADAASSMVCMENAYRFKDEDSMVYRIVTRGWHDISLKDIFGPNPRAFAKIASGFRSAWKNPDKRFEFWQAILPLAKSLQRLHQSRMLYPRINLETLRFLAEDEVMYDNFHDGKLDLSKLRLADAEVMVPFGRFATGELSGTEILSSARFSAIENHAANWHSFGCVIVDCLTRYPSDTLKESERNELRKQNILARFDQGLLSHRELLLLTYMLDMPAEPHPAYILKEMELVCADLAMTPVGSGSNPKMLLNYVRREVESLFLEDYDCPPSVDELNQAMSSRLRKASVHFVEEDETPFAYFDCGDGLWFKGYPFSMDNGATTTRCLHLARSGPPGFSKRTTVEPLSGIVVECSGDRRKTRRTIDLDGPRYQDWVSLREHSRKLHTRSADDDKRRTILATFELANQLESLMAFLNLYTCEIVSVDERKDFGISAELKPVEPKEPIALLQREIRKLAEIPQLDMFGYLSEQLETAHEEYKDQLAIASEDFAGSLSVNLGVRGKRKLDERMWKFELKRPPDEDESKWTIHISRRSPLSDKEKTFFNKDARVSVRTRGHYGQTAVIERRTKAIRQLQKYDLLIEQLVNPARKIGQTYEGNFGKPLEDILLEGKSEEERLDDNKLAILRDIFFNRPLFTLQGPPGTGKTETVRALAKLIFADDPMCQVLLTSRENSTVTDLLRKLRKESENWSERPLFHAFGKIGDGKQKRQLKDVLDVARRQVFEVCACLGESHSPLHSVLQAWQQRLGSLCGSDPELRDREALENLLERSANFIFSTASDKVLSQQVNEGCMYDWAIVEEAGRTPCYDMVLPMLAAQRWVLLGDQNQLSPFQAKEFRRMLENWRKSTELLREIDKLDASHKYISLEFINAAEERGDDRMSHFFKKDWIEAFDFLYRRIDPQEPVRERANGETAACLNTVYRLPPIVTELLRRVFYAGATPNQDTLKPADITRDPECRHAPSPLKSSPVAEPACLAGCNCVWVTTPTSENYIQDSNVGRSNRKEAELILRILESLRMTDSQRKPSLVILTPYRNQVHELKQILEPEETSRLLGEKFRPVVLNRKGHSSWVSTVDSFQGGEAEIVILSLVRNTSNLQAATPNTIGFIRDPQRANVMLSRSQRLLIIVGSYGYFELCYSADSNNADLCKFLNFLSAFGEMASSDPNTSPYIRFVTPSNLFGSTF